MKRNNKLAPDAPPLQAASVSDGPTPLQIAAQEIERLTAENNHTHELANETIKTMEFEIERLSGLTAPDLSIESRLFDELIRTQRWHRREAKLNQRLKHRLKASEARNAMLEDRVVSMQLILDKVQVNL